MNDINARRSATLKRKLAATRKAKPDRIASLHAEGLTDTEIARGARSQIAPTARFQEGEMSVSEIKFRSDIRVLLVPDVCCGSDKAMARAARVALPDAPVESPGRTIGACVSLKHNTPLEHGLMSVYIEAPGVVWWQLTRQRFMSLDSEDFAFNIESGRYRHLEPEFYVPPRERPLVEPDGFKPMKPRFDSDDETWARFVDYHRHNCLCCWENYRNQIDYGVAREVARLMLPNWSLYCDGYCTAKPLTWLQFFSKRNRTTDTATPTFPQYEIEEFARKCEHEFRKLFPMTHLAFCENGRVAP